MAPVCVCFQRLEPQILFYHLWKQVHSSHVIYYHPLIFTKKEEGVGKERKNGKKEREREREREMEGRKEGRKGGKMILKTVLGLKINTDQMIQYS